MLTAEKLRDVLSYDPMSGIFKWRVAGGQKRVGDVAGRISNQGYRQIQIRGRLYSGGRLAWLYIHGRWPEPQIDHINRDRSDDRLSNLREVTVMQNCHNRRPARGITRHSNGRWQAQIGHNGKRIYLGLFATEHHARSAYEAALLNLRGPVR